MGKFIKNHRFHEGFAHITTSKKYFYSLFAVLSILTLGTKVLFAASLSPLQQKVLLAPLQQPYQWFASTDPKGENHDYVNLKPGETRQFQLAAGNLERLWCTSSIPEKVTIALKNGGESIPLLQNNKALHGTFFQKAFTLYPAQQPDGALQRLADDAQLIATNHSDEEMKFFYQASIRPETSVETPSFEGTDEIINVSKNLKAGASVTVGDAGQLSGGVIREITISSNGETELPLQDLLLQIAQGGNEPLVQVPLAAFLGGFSKIERGKSTFKNALSEWDGKTLIIRWPMPAEKGIDNALSFRIQNTGKTASFVRVKLTFLQMEDPPKYFFAAHQGSADSVQNQPYSLIDVEGAGALMGISASMGPNPDSMRRTFAFLEGNELITADTNEYEGTGTEDFFNSAWYFPAQAYSHPYDGVSAHSDDPPRVDASRWMIDDAVPFQKQLRVSLEHGNGNRGTDLRYHWYVFWYQQNPVRFEVPNMVHSSVPESVKNAETVPQDSIGAAIGRVLLYTALFAIMVFIVLVAFAKYGQRTK